MAQRPASEADMSEALLKIEAVNCYFQGLRAVADLGFTVAAGEIKAVIGPNGAGKSTLFNMIAGVTRPTSGHIFFDGHRIDTLPTFARARLGIARTFQNLQIFREMTVLENVIAGCHLHGHTGFTRSILRDRIFRAEERTLEEASFVLLERFNLADKAYLQAGTLSYGEMKVLELARALAGEPRLLLLDEPTAGLPRAEAEHMEDVVRDLNKQGVTVLLVEHNMRMVMSLSHDILVLNHGARIAEGSGDEISRHPDVLTAYLGATDDA
jgi:branched-chain amino acid transport system ATP-binding protein